MKAGIFVVAAAIASGATASHAARRQAHKAFHLERHLLATGTGSPSQETCGCTTIYTTIYGEPTLINNPPPVPATTAPSSSAAPPASTSAPPPPPPAPTSTQTPQVPLPTPVVSVCPTPGTYTIPATTVTISETTTVCGAATTSVPAGPVTYGGVTTIVSTATTVVCPYATVKTNSGVVTSTIATTTYVCPSAGTYTIAPSTSSCSVSTVLVYPTPAVYTPGTYTREAITTTIIETDYVIYCPLTASTAKPVPTTSSIPAPVAPAPTSSAAPVVVSTPASVVPVAVAPPAVAPPASSSAASSPAPSTSVTVQSNSGSLGSSGNQWAMTYTPYTSSGQCKSASDVASDIQTIKAAGFTTVRVYSTDCSGLVNIGAACETYGLRIILGVFISSTGISAAEEQVQQIISWGKLSLVDLIVIGNEAVFNGYCSASALATFITECKSKFSGAGYSGPCTTTEPLNVWQGATSALCGVVDVVGVNIHPFFNADVEASNAGPFVASQLQIVDGLCPGKSGINLESGWPSAGSCNGKACPGSSEQATALKSITEHVGGKSVIFSFANDAWKPAGEFGCEQFWGAVHVY